MERYSIENFIVDENELAEHYKEAGNEYGYKGKSKLVEYLKELKTYKDAEEKGLLLRPKCRLGDVVYALWSIPTESKYVVYPAEVKEINLSSTNARKMIMYKLEPIAFRGRYNKYYDDDFGKLVFMSQEAAEQTLGEMQEGSNNE